MPGRIGCECTQSEVQVTDSAGSIRGLCPAKQYASILPDTLLSEVRRTTERPDTDRRD